MTRKAARASETKETGVGLGAWVGKHVAEIIGGVIVAVAVPLITGIITPQQIERAVVDVTGGTVSPSRAPSSSIRLRADGDSETAQRIAENARNPVLARLRVPEAAAKAALAYRLTQLELGTGATRQATLQWIVAMPGQGQAQCGPRAISFYSTDSLAERVAVSLNDSLAASAEQGRNLCD